MPAEDQNAAASSTTPAAPTPRNWVQPTRGFDPAFKWATSQLSTPTSYISHCFSSTSNKINTSLDRNREGAEYGLRWISFTCVEVLLLLPSAALDLTADGTANPCCLLFMVLSYKKQQPGTPLCLDWSLKTIFISWLSKVR